ncbi:hypothetical protein BJ742DRAFT_900822 [Cladochytrium replicatum]|nr:hypothetical protein BJ742DRAFT_900822 [Cladochytrium replicatum]
MESWDEEGTSWYDTQRNSGAKKAGSTKLDGRTKLHKHQEAADALKLLGYHRLANQVKTKIEWFESQYRKAASMMKHTGEGVTEDVTLRYSTWAYKVDGKFPNFDRLNKFMGEQICANPPDEIVSRDGVYDLLFSLGWYREQPELEDDGDGANNNHHDYDVDQKHELDAVSEILTSQESAPLTKYVRNLLDDKNDDDDDPPLPVSTPIQRSHRSPGMDDGTKTEHLMKRVKRGKRFSLAEELLRATYERGSKGEVQVTLEP